MRSGITAAGGRAIEPYVIHVEDEVLDDLRRRIHHTRWPIEPRSRPWEYGTDLSWMKDVAAYWSSSYNWRKCEKSLNAFSHFRADIEGRKIHFILERGSGPEPLPLILTHGWPGSVVEFLAVIEQLAHPERFGGDARDAFTVIVPSLPGYGFSDPPEAPITPFEIARQWSKLMTECLGFNRYVAQGGDWGGIVTAHLALSFPEKLAAIHLNIAALRPTESSATPFTDEEKAWLVADAERRADLSGYRWIQGTRPQTLAYGLTDSPVGLAAWILEKFHDWTIRDQPTPPPFDIDTLLTNVMLYWVNGINPANWLYTSLMTSSGRVVPVGARVEIPTGFMLCPNDLGPPPPDSWLERVFNVTHRKDAEKGGHFLALEQPHLFVSEVRSFFASYR